MSVIFYPGSFDPFTNGHLDVLVRTAQVFDRVVVGVVENIHKCPLFSLEERKQMIQESLEYRNINNVEVIIFQGLAVSFMKERSITIMLRGIRVISDFENEMKIAFNNKDIFPEIEVFFLFTNPQYGHISASTVKEIASLGGDVSVQVPPSVLRRLKSKYKGGT